MKTLILTCNTGEGHNSTASAICDVFAAHGVVCDRADTLAFLSPFASKTIGEWHSRIYRYMPKAFSMGYRAAEQHPNVFDKKSQLYRLLTKGAKKLRTYVTEGGYDVIVCTHAFSALLVTGMREKYPEMKLYATFIATDYTCSPSVNESRMDAYFIPDASLAEEFVSKGVPADRIVATGLPVRRDFLTKQTRAQACRACGLPEDGYHLLMMLGSMGCGPMEVLTQQLSEQLPKDVILTVICGTNKQLYRKLSRRFADQPRIRVCGYVRNVPELMDCSDLYLTKPGGISVTEAAAKRLPMVLVNAVSGCEEYNLHYYLKRDMAMTAETPEKLSGLCVSLLKDQAALEKMKQQLERYAHNDAAERIYAHLQAASAENDHREVCS